MSFKISATSMSDPPDIESISIAGMYGGLNLRSDPEDVQSTQSPDMVNMWYRDGLLRKRWGQKLLAKSDTTHERVVQFCDRLWNGYLVWVDETVIKYAKPSRPDIAFTVKGIVLPVNTPRGCFVPYEEWLFYKAPGAYVRLKIDDTLKTPVGEWILSGTTVNEDLVYTPIIAINRNADGTGGDSYQPENRIDPRKIVWFDTDESSTDYYLPSCGAEITQIQVGDNYTKKYGTEQWRASDTEYATDAYDKVPTLDGRTFDLHEQDAGSIVNDYITASVPLYVDRSAWKIIDYAIDTNPVTGYYLNNVLYSSKAVYPDNSTRFYNQTVLSLADDDMPSEIGTSLVQQALDSCPADDLGDNYVVTVSDTRMNVLISGAFPVVSANNDDYSQATKFGLTDCVQMCYMFASSSWVVTDYQDKASPVGYGTDHVVYTTFNPQDASGNYLFGTSVDGTSHTGVMQYYGDTEYEYPELMSLYELACLKIADYCGVDDVADDVGLWWTASSSSSYYFYFYLKDASACHCITGVSDDNTAFGAAGIIKVSIPKTGTQLLLSDDWKLTWYGEPTSIGFKVENITYSAQTISYNVYYPACESTVTIGDQSFVFALSGNAIIRQTEGDLQSDIGSYYKTAWYLAKELNDQGKLHGGKLTGNYIVVQSSSGNYLGFMFEVGFTTAEFCIYSFDIASTQYSATHFVRVTLDKSALKTDTDITLTTPALFSNQLRVTYRYETDDSIAALKAISDCKYAIDFGGSDAVCIAMANCEAQPNAIFWSGNGSSGVDPTYFPMDQYNLAGTYQDPINALAKYASYLIVLQGHQTSKGTYSIETNSNTSRNFIDIALATINPNRGCDMPWSVQMAQNYLCWMDSRYGCLYLSDTSEANENSVLCISENVNGSRYRHGLMYALQNTDNICSFDDGFRIYWFIGNELWVWDYSIASVSSDGIYALSWTRHTGFDVRSATSADTHRIFLLNPSGDMIEMSDDFDDDMGESIACHYTSPTQTMGGFYTKKNVKKLIVECSSKNGGRFRIVYGSERSANPGKENDVSLKESAWLYEQQREFTDHFVLKPRLLHVNHFYFRVESDGDDGGLAISNAIITYTAGGVNK